MQRDIEKVNDFTKKITLVWDKEDVEGLFKDKVAELKTKIQVPGFRVGKAPISIIRTRFGEVLLQEIKQDIIEKKIYDEIGIEDNDILGFEDMEMEDMKFQEPFKIVCTVEVKPEIKVENFKGFKLEKKIFTPSEDAIDEAIENLRGQFASLEEIEKPAKDGDYVVAKLGEDLKYLPISENLTEDSKKELIGLKKGDEKEIKITFPNDYVDKTLAGKDYNGPASVTMIKSRKLPDLNLTFMKSVFPDVKKKAEFREKVAENLKKQSTEMTEGSLRNEAVKALLDANPFDVPNSALRQELMRKLTYQYGVDSSKIEREKIDQLVEESKDELKNAVLSRWLLEEIVRDQSIELADGDFEDKIKEISASGGMDLASVKEQLEKTGETQNLKTDILVEKALNLIIENADIQEKEVNLGEKETK